MAENPEMRVKEVVGCGEVAQGIVAILREVRGAAESCYLRGPWVGTGILREPGSPPFATEEVAGLLNRNMHPQKGETQMVTWLES